MRNSNSYLMRHWRGEMSLGVSYWLNATVFGAGGAMLLGSLARETLRNGHNLRLSSSVGVVLMVLGTLIWFWGAVGIWRSARQHVSRGGSAAWAAIAKVMVLVGAIFWGTQWTQRLGPQAWELAQIAAGHDPLPAVRISISPDGRSAALDGTMGEGSAKALRAALAGAPEVRRLELHSVGGRMLEGTAIAQMVRERKLDTYVQVQCESACTLIFLAGLERAATPKARIGFHRPSLVAASLRDESAITADTVAEYRAAGMPADFIDKITRTSAQSMWYPTHTELLAANAVTRTATGGETVGRIDRKSRDSLRAIYAADPFWQAVDARFPGSLDMAADRAWAASGRGAPDIDVIKAGNTVADGLTMRLLRTAQDAQLDEFLALFNSQLAAARATSAQNCSNYLAGAALVPGSMPEALEKREELLIRAMLQAEPRRDVRPPAPEALHRALGPVLATVPMAQIQIVQKLRAHGHEPDVQCEAARNFFGAVAKLALADRRVVLHSMYQRSSAVSASPARGG
ncbi:ATP-dependent Clp protease proteolytic subunit [Variovorax sp. W2I14]|uniref:ATP-dependent Clp protease proteolytic subunit n=1 Tax=Variovorax sp. W2I14 TaxID=3042290 RepID=UPI003D24395F